MASKKSSRKVPVKKPLKAKVTLKKKVVAKKGKAKPASKPTATKKKTKSASAKKGTGVTKKATKVAKPPAKKKAPTKSAAGKKKVAGKKAASKKVKADPKKQVIKSVAKSKASTKKKVPVQKKKTPIAKTKVQSPPPKKPTKKFKKPSSPEVQRVPTSKEPLLSPRESTNIGGLFACAIDRRNDPDFSRLRAVLRHLNLSPQEKDNFIRQSQGFMIPKLFAENLPEPKVIQLLADLVKFGVKQGDYENHWRDEIQQIGFWLGVFPAQFQAVEQQAKR